MKAGHVPVWHTVVTAYHLIWRERRLHALAIWPPIVFLVTAEFCYRKIFHGGDSLAKIWGTLNEAPWYWIAGLAVCWLAGLKFLLSFSISWRRHLLLGEKFDPFFFKQPFWRYLGFLLLTYGWLLCWIGLALAVAFGSYLDLFGVGAIEDGPTVYDPRPDLTKYTGLIMVFFLLPGLWLLIRQIPYFTAIALGPASRSSSRTCFGTHGTTSSDVSGAIEQDPHAGKNVEMGPETRGFAAVQDDDIGLGLKQSFTLMRGNVVRYLAVWILAMAPVLAFTMGLSHLWKALGLDLASTPVALTDSALRQAALFIHFSLGASIGAAFYKQLVRNESLS